MDFKGKVAVVTGGANGIGREVCLGIHRGGGKVLIVDRDAAAGQALAAEIGSDARFFAADVTQAKDVMGYVRAALDAFGRIDCFHNNAGIEGKVAPIVEYDDAVFDMVQAINVRGVYLGLKHVMAVMQKQGGGSIVNTASVAGMVGTPGMGAYVASKHAVMGLTKVAAGEVGPQGIRVNAVCPGPIRTRMVADIAKQVSPNNPDGVESRYTSGIPLRRYGEAIEVANLVLFLLSDLASNITGAQYTEYLEKLIRATRQKASWDIPWFVALTTIHTPTEAPDDPVIGRDEEIRRAIQVLAAKITAPPTRVLVPGRSPQIRKPAIAAQSNSRKRIGWIAETSARPIARVRQKCPAEPNTPATANNAHCSPLGMLQNHRANGRVQRLTAIACQATITSDRSCRVSALVIRKLAAKIGEAASISSE